MSERTQASALVFDGLERPQQRLGREDRRTDGCGVEKHALGVWYIHGFGDVVTGHDQGVEDGRQAFACECKMRIAIAKI